MAQAEDPEARKHLIAAGGLYPHDKYDGPHSFTFVVPGQGEFASAPPVKLTYFAIRALGELPTLILEVAGYPYTNVRVFDTSPATPSVFVDLKRTLPLGRMPLLEDGPTVISQSAAVTRHVAKKTGLDGGSDDLRARCDMLFEFLNSDTKVEMQIEPMLELPASAGVATSFDEYAKQTYDGIDSATPTNKGISHLRQWEMIVSNGWVLSSPQGGGVDKLSYVDLALWMFTDQLGATWLQSHGFMKLAAHHAAVEGLPALASYLKSTRLMPAFKPDDYSYLSDKWVSMQA